MPCASCSRSTTTICPAALRARSGGPRDARLGERQRGDHGDRPVRRSAGGWTASPLALTLDACLEAIDDAGLRREDIDGLATYPGAMGRRAGLQRRGRHRGAGRAAPRARLVLRRPRAAGPARLGHQRLLAVAAGLARHVLCFRTVWESTAQGGGPARGHRGGRAAGVPRRAASCSGRCPSAPRRAAVWIAMMAQRHFHEFGTTREQLAWIALNGRRHAARNPKADLPRAADARRLPRRRA